MQNLMVLSRRIFKLLEQSQEHGINIYFQIVKYIGTINGFLMKLKNQSTFYFNKYNKTCISLRLEV